MNKILFITFQLLLFHLSHANDRFQLDLQLLDSNSSSVQISTTFHQVQVKLFSAANGGAAAYTQTINSVNVQSGVMSLNIGGVGTPLPNLTQNRYLEMTVTRNNGDVPVVLSPRLLIKANPLSVDTEKISGNSFNDILAVIQASSYSDSNAVAAALASNRFLSKHGSQTSTSAITFQNSGANLLLSGNLIDMDLTGVGPGAATTVFGVKKNNQYLFSVLSDGNIQAVGYRGDGSALTGIVGGGGGGALVADSVDTVHIKANAVTASKIADNTILGSKIVAGTIPGDKLQNGAITALKIGSGAINSDKILVGAVEEAKLANGAVTTNKIAGNAIVSNRIADGTIATIDLADSVITNEKLANAAVTSQKLSSSLTVSTRLGLMNLVNISNSGNDVNYFGLTNTSLVFGANQTTNQLVLHSAGNVGIGVINPQSKLHVSGGGLCVDDAASCTGQNTAGTIYANNAAVQGVDYAEYFEQEEPLQAGDIVGLNFQTGLVRKYRSGDGLVGVVSTQPGVIGGRNRDPLTHALVALIGQVPVAQDQIKLRGRRVETLDGLRIGWQLSNGDVFLKFD